MQKNMQNINSAPPLTVAIGRNVKRSGYLMFAMFLFLMTTSTPRASAQLPGDHKRWIGTWEEESGKGEVYDFYFSENAQVLVEKSTGSEKVSQTYHWQENAGNILLSETTKGPIPELASAELKKAGDQLYHLTLGENQVIKIRRSLTAVSWMHALFLFAFVFVGNELARRYKPVPYIWFFVLPFALIPLFLHSGFDSVFRWTKLYSAVVGCVFFTLFRFQGLHKYKWAKVAVAVILAVNILEACLQDYSAGHMANYLNAAAGILNILTISRWLGLKRDPNAPNDMLWPGMTVAWIIAYDIWNITFVYLNFPNTVLFTICILIAPTLAALFVKKGTWMQARAYALGIYMIYIFSFKSIADNYFNLQFTLPLPRNEAIVMGLALLSIGWNVVYAILHFRWRFTGKAPASLQVGQSESVIG